MTRTNCVRCKSFWTTTSVGAIISILSVSLINGWITYTINWDELRWFTEGTAKTILTGMILSIPGMVGTFGITSTMHYCKGEDTTKLELYMGVGFVTLAIILLAWIVPVVIQIWQ